MIEKRNKIGLGRKLNLGGYKDENREVLVLKMEDKIIRLGFNVRWGNCIKNLND